MDALEIGSPSDHLRLSPAADGATLHHLVAVLAVEGLSATKKVYAHYAFGWRDLADFFGELAGDWRGWSGVREWTSLESDLKIEAKHDGGHVRLHVTLRQDWPHRGGGSWTVCVDLAVEPGEQLRRLADDIKDLANQT